MRYFLVITILFVHIDLYSQSTFGDYPYNVGDIAFDSATDNPDFEVIDEKKVRPYAKCSMMIEGERYGVIEYFAEHFKPKPVENATGYITVRFMVNRKGQTDRFRMYEMDNNFQQTTFDKTVSGKIFDLTKKLSGWKPLIDDKGNQYDYYQYIVFKIKNGLIEYILP
ncbi:MAG: hypothetical protein LBS43_01900 [Prevotellaceae bacterium]|jgi:predicted SnoaL-like aldol condensation-catalyzing enzyme|nr:hypothetical protein [Prevotellaceae bacterium]